MNASGRDLLFLSPFPASPPTFGAQRRIEGLMTALGKRHRLTAVAFAGEDYDRAAAERAMGQYCERVVLVPDAGSRGLKKRVLQLRSLVSPVSWERQHGRSPAMRAALRSVLTSKAFDAISVELPFLAGHELRVAPAGHRPPRVILDEHNIEFDLARQSLHASTGALRKLHHAVNWPKIRAEERKAWRTCDGVAFCSDDDLARARALVPEINGVVVPNAVDVDRFKPGPSWPSPDGRTIVFFGTMNYFPNLEGMTWFLSEIWPRMSAALPTVRLQVIGSHPPPAIQRHAGPRVEIAGLVDDVRPHLARAAAVIVPLRVGGGTRFKILEAMAMGRPIVSTRLGAEGIAAKPEEEILLADTPEDFTAAVGRLIADAPLAERMGARARTLVERLYSWDAAAERYERLLLGAEPAAGHHAGGI